jgi:hypothetical protein
MPWMMFGWFRRATGAGLAQEALAELVVLRVLGRQALDGDHAVHGDLEGLVDRAHGALADLGQDLVALDGGVAALHPLVLEDLLHLAFGDVALGQHDFAQLLGGDAQLLHLLLEAEALVDLLQRGEARA